MAYKGPPHLDPAQPVYRQHPLRSRRRGDSVQCTEVLWKSRLFCTPSLTLSQTPYSMLMERKMLRGLSR